VIDVALLGITRRWHLHDRVGISRNTVRRYLRAETVEPAYPETFSDFSRQIRIQAFGLVKDRDNEVTQATKDFEVDAHRSMCVEI